MSDLKITGLDIDLVLARVQLLKRKGIEAVHFG